MPLSLLLLAWLPASACPPLPLVLLLAAGYAVCQTLIWASVVYMGPRHLVNILGGLIGSSVNLLPTLLPGLVLSGSNLPADLTILSVVGFFGIGAFVGAAIQVSGGVPSDAAEDVVAASAKKKEKKETPSRPRSSCATSRQMAADGMSGRLTWRVDEIARAVSGLSFD